jgi:hypothetical protein
MSQDTMRRREALLRAVGLGTVTLVPAWALAACKGQLSCTDTSGLAPADTTLRSQLQYMDKSATPAKVCSGCKLYKPGAEGQCGSCTLIKGPINPGGNCTSWVAKDG